jgi:hypothetical protein
MRRSDNGKYNGRSTKLKLSYVLIFILAVVIAGGGYLGYEKINSLEREKQQLSDPQEAARLETQRIKEKVSQLIEVPQDEDPTIANVVDVSKLSDQEFFKNAQNDDKVLMYAKSKKAILYRPSTNKIIEVAPINIGDNQEDNSTSTKNPVKNEGVE